MSLSFPLTIARSATTAINELRRASVGTFAEASASERLLARALRRVPGYEPFCGGDTGQTIVASEG